jgi:hypothetical protein
MGAELDSMRKTNTRKAPQSALPPELRPFAMIPRDVLRSDAWRSLGINERRVIDFLLLEYLSKGGRENGKLKAPYSQLIQIGGVAARYVASAIAGAERRGLIAAERGGLRVATVYTIAWLPMPDGTMPAQAWRTFRAADLPYKGKARLPYKGKADASNLPYKGKVDGPGSLPYKGNDLSRIVSNHAGADSISQCGDPAAAPVVPLRRAPAAGEGR